MSKKSFRTSFDDLLGGGNTDKREFKKDIKHTETKSTFVIRCDHLDKIKAISFMERKMIKEVLAESLENYIQSYEKINGNIILPKT